jgi:hypothetical protein
LFDRLTANRDGTLWCHRALVDALHDALPEDYPIR